MKTPVHRHTTFAETFEVLDGKLTVVIGGRANTLVAGDVTTVPIGAGHRFANLSDEHVRFRCSLEPASRGFEEAQQLIAGLAADGQARGPLPKDPRYVGLLVHLMDTSFAGPMRALNPIFRALGRLGGRDLETLRDRYVRW